MAKNLLKQLAVHNLRGKQAQWTKKQALAWAWERHKTIGLWPAARFRVEGGRGGNSRLLSEKAATRSWSKYGGRVVELIPTAKAAGVPRATAHNFSAGDLPACTVCGAEVGFGCRGKARPLADGTIKPGRAQKQPHLDRIMLGLEGLVVDGKATAAEERAVDAWRKTRERTEARRRVGAQSKRP